MQILSLNAWGGRVHAALMRFVGQAEADVFCFQEVTRSAGAHAEWLIYRDGPTELPQRADLFAELRAALPRHDAFFCPAARGSLFDGEKALPSEWGLATFVREGFPVIGQALDFVHGGFCAGGWGPHPRARNAHGLRLFDYEKGFAVTVVQTHGLRDPAGKGDTPARQEQAEALASLCRRLWCPGERLVVCGDFNVLPDSGTFAVLAELGLSDLVTGRSFTDTRTSLYAKPGRFADYMLTTPEVDVRRFEVVAEPEVSDHRALLLELG